MQQNLQTLYKRALDMRSAWQNRWDDARRYTIPASDSDIATLYDSTASDAVASVPSASPRFLRSALSLR